MDIMDDAYDTHSSTTMWKRARKDLYAQKAIVLENILPAPDSWADKNSRISFDVVAQNTILATSVRVWVEGVLAWNGSTASFVAPYSGTYSNATMRRLRLEIQKSSPWPWQNPITVRVQVRDMFGNILDETWEFSGDSGPPFILWADPWYGGRLVEDGYLNFFITDDNAGVVGTTIDAYVGGEWAVTLANWPTPIFKAPYDGPLSDAYQTTLGGYDGYWITVQRTSLYATGKQWNLRALAQDKLTRQMDTTWILNTMPFIEIIEPADGSHNNAPRALMDFWILDAKPLLQSSIDAYDAEFQLISKGVILPEWDFLSSIVSGTHDGYDGYHVVLNPSPYPYYGLGSHWHTNSQMRIVAKNSDGYQMDYRLWEFHVDNLAPHIENEYPPSFPDGQPLDAVVEFDVLDYESGTEGSVISVSIDEGDGPALAYTAAGGFVAPYDGVASAVTAVGRDGYHIAIQKTEDWDIGAIEMLVYARDYVNNQMEDGWDWYTGHARFDLRARSGADRPGHKLVLGGPTAWPSFAYNAIHCQSGSWPSWDGYGSTLSPYGSGSTTLNMGSPLNGNYDDSVRQDGSRWWTGSDGDVAKEDFVVEALVRTPHKSTGNGRIVRRGNLYPGWNITVEDAPADPYGWVGKRIRATMGSAGTQHTIVSNTLWYDAWYHVFLVCERNGYMLLYINGKLHSYTSVIDLDNVDISSAWGLGMGEFAGNIGFVRFWYGSAIAGGALSTAVPKRFRQMCGVNPLVTFDTEARRERPSFKHLDSKGYIHRVGEDWVGTSMRKDLADTWREGVLSEAVMVNGCGAGDCEFGNEANGKWYGQLGWSIWRPTAPNRVSDALYCETGIWYTFTSLVTLSGSGARTVFSTYVKASSGNFVHLRLDCKDGANDTRILLAIYNLSAQTSRIYVENPLNVATEAGIEPLAEGWYRIWVAGPSSSLVTWVSNSLTPRVGVSTSLTNLASPGGSWTPGTVWFWFWGPQIERSNSNRPSSLFDWAHHTSYPTRDRRADLFAFYSTTNCWDGYNNIRADIVTRDESVLDEAGTAAVLLDVTLPGGFVSVSAGLVGSARIVDGAADTTLTGTSDIADGDRHSVDIEYDGGGADLVVDNAVERSGTPDIPASPGCGYIYIGSDRLASGFCPDAIIRKIRIWVKE
jgi:hypothetical protein